MCAFAYTEDTVQSAINIMKHGHDPFALFTFRVTDNGRTRDYSCESHTAIAVSPKAEEYIIRGKYTMAIEISDPMQYFALLESHWNGKELPINDDNAQFLKEVADILGNTQLRKHVNLFELEKIPISDNNVCDKLDLKLELGYDASEEIGYIARKIKDVYSHLANCPVRVLEEVLSHRELTVESENQICDLVLDCIAKDSAYASLLQYVKCASLDQKHLDRFMDTLQKHPEMIDSTVLGNIRDAIRKLQDSDLDRKCIVPRMRRIIRMLPSGVKPVSEQLFNGIFQFMRLMCSGRNPHEAKAVRVTGSPNANAKALPHYVLNYQTQFNSSWNWSSTNAANSFIEFDFAFDNEVPGMCVCIKQYAVKSTPDRAFQVKTWELQGWSDSNHKWEIIDPRMDVDLNDFPSKIGVFYVPNNNTFYSRIRFVQTKANVTDNHLRLAGIEFYGILKNLDAQ